MRSAIIVSAFVALAAAAPRPQEIEFDLVDAAPDAVPVVPPINVTSDDVEVAPVASAVAAAVADVTSVATTQKRDFLDLASSLSRRDIACEKQPAGVAAYTVTT